MADLARTAHRIAHERAVLHLRLCRGVCLHGGLCSTGSDYLDAADDAGLAWERAERGRP